MEKQVVINKVESYQKHYNIHLVGAPKRGQITVTATIPKEIVEREARRRGMTLREFKAKFGVKWYYDNFEGALVEFVPLEEKP